MLNAIYTDSKREIADLHAAMVGHIESTEEPDINYLADGAKNLLKTSETALRHALTHEQYMDVLNLAGIWKFFLDARQIRYEFCKPRRQDLFKESFLKASPKTASFSPLQPGFWSDGKVIVGIALRDTIDRTVPIKVERNIKHKGTGKHIRRSKKFLIHDEFNSVSAGDKVLAYECRPISKRKNFMLSAILD